MMQTLFSQLELLYHYNQKLIKQYFEKECIFILSDGTDYKNIEIMKDLVYIKRKSGNNQLPKGECSMRNTIHYIKRFLLLVVLLAVYHLLHRHLLPLTAGANLLYWIALVMMWMYHIKSKVVHPAIRQLILAFGGTIECLLIFTLIKYEVGPGFPLLMRYMWYMYYLPFLLMPTILFSASQLVFSSESRRMSKKDFLVYIPPLTMFLIVITNDLHFLTFVPTDGLENIESSYSYGVVYYLVLAWIALSVIAFYVVLIIKCKNFKSRKMYVLPISALILAALLFTMNFTSIDKKIIGYQLLSATEIIMLSLIVLVECCIDADIFPTNSGHSELMRHTSLVAVIADTDGNPVYSSESAEIPDSVLALPCEDNSTIIGTNRFETRPITGGKVIWKEDISDILEKNEALRSVIEQLSEEANIAKSENEIRQSNEEYKAKNEIFNRISAITEPQTNKILEILSEECDSDEKEKHNLAKITANGVYIKRRANLELIASNTPVLDASDLVVSVNEVLHYLELCNAECSSTLEISGEYTSKSIIAAFEIMKDAIADISENGGSINVTAENDELCIDYNGTSACAALAKEVTA